MNFLRGLHLFRGLSEAELKTVAEAFEERVYPTSDLVFAEGTITDRFYLIFDGFVQISRLVKEKPEKLATLSKGDYFGEGSLLSNRTHNATARADKGTVLLVLPRASFKNLISRIDDLRYNFEIMVNTRDLANQLRFPWLGENETVYYLARKHVVLLLQMIGGPFVVLLLPLTLIGASAGMGMETGIGTVLLFSAALTFFIDLLWAIWIYIDWGNDYYVVTNQRVIWIEKVIGLYESREEAMMTTVLSINTESDQWGRIMGFGTVIVRTFTGQIRMEYVHHPKQAAAMIEEFWNRTKSGRKKADEESMKQAIRAKLGIQLPGAAQASAAPPAPPAPKPIPKPTLSETARLRLGGMFKVREESGNTITYHKHPFVLFRDTLPQFGSLILVIALYVVLGYFGMMQLWMVSLLTVALVAVMAWWYYGYLDWKNDVYQVTAEHIVDVYKEPFGIEDRKSAPLENILSTNFKRSGILGMLLNFGTVFIQVGGANFDFADVMDPASVQQDIIRRMQVRLSKKREVDSAADRDRMIDWMSWYHKTVEEARQAEEQARKNLN